MPEVEAESRSGEAASYRREATEIRAILDSIRDERFREQLRQIANQYEAVAVAIEKVRAFEQQQQPDAAD
jgi:hypothetical protein